MDEFIQSIEVEYVAEFPEKLERGKLYIHERYPIALHLCACGCGIELANSLFIWRMLIENDDSITLTPTLRNPACKSQYSIIKNQIIWI